MLKYFGTTTLILLWCGLLATMWAWAAFALRVRRRPSRMAPLNSRRHLEGGLIVPALVVAPLTLLCGFRVAGINLLFPIHAFATVPELMVAAFPPAVVLLVTSGLAGTLTRSLRRELTHWQAQPFVRTARALGKPVPQTLRRLVLLKSLGGAFAASLPWLFGDLIVVEAVFNAPGLGLEAWEAAKTRDLASLGGAMVWLAALYLAAVALTAWCNQRLGRRLESYG